MLQTFDENNRAQAVLLSSNVNGFITVQGIAPFWVGTSQSLGTISPVPPGGSNWEVRDGVYFDENNCKEPHVLPWAGAVYVLNGNAAADQLNNVVTVQVVNEC